jgi:hypothetical protein
MSRMVTSVAVGMSWISARFACSYRRRLEVTGYLCSGVRLRASNSDNG